MCITLTTGILYHKSSFWGPVYIYIKLFNKPIENMTNNKISQIHLLLEINASWKYRGVESDNPSDKFY